MVRLKHKNGKDNLTLKKKQLKTSNGNSAKMIIITRMTKRQEPSRIERQKDTDNAKTGLFLQATACNVIMLFVQFHSKSYLTSQTIIILSDHFMLFDLLIEIIP